jgi:hypothetical protein
MQQNDFPKFRQVLVGMTQMYGREATSEMLDIYWAALKSIPLTEFMDLANYLITTEEFMPTVARFMNLRKRADGQSGSEAWIAILDNVKHSQYRYGQTVGGLVDQAIRAVGGYSAVGMANVDDLGWMQKRFEAAYAELSLAQEARQALMVTQNHPAELPPSIRLAITTAARHLKAT